MQMSPDRWMDNAKYATYIKIEYYSAFKRIKFLGHMPQDGSTFKILSSIKQTRYKVRLYKFYNGFTYGRYRRSI